jgi:hypothetical protein
MSFNENKLLLLGSAKTGTTSLYHFLSSHPQIHPSSTKEPLFCYRSNNGFLTPEIYKNYWNHTYIKPNDFLLDGTPSWWDPKTLKQCNVIKIFNKLKFKEIHCLFVLRIPYTDYWRSLLQFTFKLVKYYNFPEIYITKKGHLNIKAITQEIKNGFRLQLARIEKIIGINNIHIIELNQVEENQESIYRTLGINLNHKEKFERINITSMDLWEHRVATSNILSFIEHTQYFIEMEQKRDVSNISKRYNWIK